MRIAAEDLAATLLTSLVSWAAAPWLLSRAWSPLAMLLAWRAASALLHAATRALLRGNLDARNGSDLA